MPSGVVTPAGGPAAVAAYVHLSADINPYSTNVSIPFDVVDFDPDGYYHTHMPSSNLPGFAIPSGNAGLHIVGFTAVAVSGNTETSVQGIVGNNGAQSNPFVNIAPENLGATIRWWGTCVQLINAAAGDQLDASVGADVSATLTLKGGGNATIFWIVKLG